MIDTHGVTRIRVLLVEDHNMVRQGLRALLTAEDSITVVGEARNGRDAIELVRKLRPEVVVMDIAMPLLNGVEATRQIRGLYPATKILILSAHREDEYVEHAIEAGAGGYIVKENAADVLVKAIQEVHRGGRYLSLSISKRLDDIHESRIAHGQRPGTRGVPLTSREQEVLQLIAEGMANKATAAHLGISIKTVEKHRQHLKAKLGIHDTAGLTRYALSAGIIESRGSITFE
jgi:DNA-binding NarL/FixJ family response regulator